MAFVEYHLQQSAMRIESKGLQTLINESKECADGKWNIWKEQTFISVHSACRKSYSLYAKTPRNRKLKSLDTFDVLSEIISESLAATDAEMSEPVYPRPTSSNEGCHFDSIKFMYFL